MLRVPNNKKSNKDLLLFSQKEEKRVIYRDIKKKKHSRTPALSPVSSSKHNFINHSNLLPELNLNTPHFQKPS